MGRETGQGQRKKTRPRIKETQSRVSYILCVRVCSVLCPWGDSAQFFRVLALLFSLGVGVSHLPAEWP